MGFFFHQVMPDYVVLGMPLEEFEKMMDWAFGDKWRTTPIGGLAENWNAKHSDIFEIAGHDDISSTTRKMKKEWDKLKEKVKRA